MAEMIEKIAQIRARFAEVERLVADPDLHKDQKRAVETMREHARLSEILEAYERIDTLRRQIRENEELLHGEEDPEMRSMAEEELGPLRETLEREEQRFTVLLIPPDPLDSKNTIMEIRAGTGGDEASLFAADLYRMYIRYAESMGWKTELIEANESEVGGFKEVIFSITGNEVYSHLKFESGVHRVQRVPTTESGGRIHTSAVTVAVLP
ncbi:MAG: PCRF domain-containing protein, partial [Alkalispirochaeta sp.]